MRHVGEAAGVDNAAATITARDIYRRISILADDSMAGRDTPSPGFESAARYVCRRVSKLNFEPAGEEGGCSAIRTVSKG